MAPVYGTDRQSRLPHLHCARSVDRIRDSLALHDIALLQITEPAGRHVGSVKEQLAAIISPNDPMALAMDNSNNPPGDRMAGASLAGP